MCDTKVRSKIKHKFKNIILILTILLICLYILFGLLNISIPNQETENIVIQVPDVIELKNTDNLVIAQDINNQSQQITASPRNIAKDETKINTIKKCISYDEANELAENSVMAEWFRDTLFINGTLVSHLITNYQYQEEETLLQEAHAGDSKAMWVLGKNYLWQSTHRNFQSKYLIPNDVSSIEYEEKPLDLEMLEKSRYWLFQSALHGEYAGLWEYQSAFSPQLKLLIETGDIVDDPDYWITHSRAYSKLIDWAFPSYPKAFGPSFRDTNVRGEKYSKEILDKTDEIYNEIRNRWISQRTLLGYPEKIELYVPKDVSDMYKIVIDACY